MPFDALGVQPAKQSSAKTPFRPDVPCETQDPPNLNTGVAPPVPTTRSTNPGPTGGASTAVTTLSNEYADIYTDLMTAKALQESGDITGAAALNREASERLRIFNKDLLPDYRDALADLTGGGG